MSDTVLVEDQGAVRVLTLNRPTKLNAMNAELVDTLIGAVRAADLDDAVAVVILTGAGRAFSAGADISRGTTEPSPRQVIARARRMGALFRALSESTKPVVAAVHGYALGGGCSLVMSCDLVVAAVDDQAHDPARGFHVPGGGARDGGRRLAGHAPARPARSTAVRLCA